MVKPDPLADLQAMVNQALGSTDRYVLNSEAVVDEGPQFLAYFVFVLRKGASGNQVAAAVLQNGAPQSRFETLPSRAHAHTACLPRRWSHGARHAAGRCRAPSPVTRP